MASGRLSRLRDGSSQGGESGGWVWVLRFLGFGETFQSRSTVSVSGGSAVASLGRVHESLSGLGSWASPLTCHFGKRTRSPATFSSPSPGSRGTLRGNLCDWRYGLARAVLHEDDPVGAWRAPALIAFGVLRHSLSAEVQAILQINEFCQAVNPKTNKVKASTSVIERVLDHRHALPFRTRWKSGIPYF